MNPESSEIMQVVLTQLLALGGGVAEKVLVVGEKITHLSLHPLGVVVALRKEITSRLIPWTSVQFVVFHQEKKATKKE